MTQKERDYTDDYNAELGLLGAFFVDPTLIAKHAAELSSSDFMDCPGGVGPLFDFLVSMHEAGKNITDFQLLKLELSRSDICPTVASPSFLGKLMNGAGFTWNARFYIDTIKRNSDIRRLQFTAADLAERLKQVKADPKEIREWLDARLASSGSSEASQVSTIGDIANRIVHRLRQPKPATGGRPLMTGLYRHDSEIGGWMPGELIVLAARPGMGKTALATQVAKFNAASGRRALFVSIEMTEEELGARILAGHASVDSRNIRSGDLLEEEIAGLEAAARDIQADQLSIWAPSSRHAGIANIRGMAKYMVATGGLRLIVVDYIGLVKPADPRRQRHEQIGEITNGLKSLAKEVGVPVLALCQLNREADVAEPKLSHLRESGNIEQDADCVMFLHRDRPEIRDCSLIIAKHRHSSTGAINLRWIPERTLFEDPSGGQNWNF
jgi:replicative DNA helicase